MKLKKADLSINTIVSAAIAILVLLVIIMIFTNNIRKPANELERVNDDRGDLIDNIITREKCTPSSNCVLSENCNTKTHQINPLYSCDDGKVCCELK